MNEWTAAEIGVYDQLLADAGADLDRLVRMLRIGLGEVSEHQALANVGLFLSGRQPSELTGLLTVALKRLAAKDSDPS